MSTNHPTEKTLSMGIMGRKKEIGTETILQRNNNILFNVVDGEVVMLSIENSEYYGFDLIGSRIWELLENKITLGEIITKLTNEYNVEDYKCLQETSFFINSLLKRNLLIIE